MTIRLNFRVFRRPWCWVDGHWWRYYTVVNVWCREGRYCEWCGKEQLVSYRLEFIDGQTVYIRTDWNGTERFIYESHGAGTTDDPIRLERVPFPATKEGDQS